MIQLFSFLIFVLPFMLLRDLYNYFLPYSPLINDSSLLFHNVFMSDITLSQVYNLLPSFGNHVSQLFLIVFLEVFASQPPVEPLLI